MARTLTSTTRLLETLALFHNDFRVKFVFTINNTTQFSGGVERLLWDSGVDHVVPWSELSAIRYDLILSASENIDFDKVTGPVVVLPHGLGFNKYVPDPAGAGTRLAGLPPAAALRSGRVTLVLTHPDQDSQLRAAAPETEGHTVVTGDLTCDRLLASRAVRERYRARLGTDGRRLVLVSSTWRPHSLLGQWRTLPRQLLAELPVDDYQVATVLHPNIWSWYGPAQIRVWFANALDSGLVLIPPHHGWHAALVAADQVIADHGSMGLHTAALDIPLLLSTADQEVVASTPVAELARTAQRLDLRGGLREQLDESIATHVPGRFDRIISGVFAHRGEAAQRLRAELYELLQLPQPETDPPLLRAPDPEPELRAITALRVSGSLTAPHGITLTRYPDAAGPNRTDHHLVVDEAETDLRLSERAAVLARRRSSSTADAWSWAESALSSYPYARLAVAATDEGCALLLRGGSRFFLVERTGQLDALALGSVGYVQFLTGRLAEGITTVHLGRRSCQVALTPVQV